MVDSFMIVGLVQFPVYILYMAYVLKRLYQISIKKILIKTLLFLIYGGVLYFIVAIVVVALMMISGAIEIPTK